MEHPIKVGDIVSIVYLDGARGSPMWVAEVRDDGVAEIISPDDPFGVTTAVPVEWLEKVEGDLEPVCVCPTLVMLNRGCRCGYLPVSYRDKQSRGLV